MENRTMKNMTKMDMIEELETAGIYRAADFKANARKPAATIRRDLEKKRAAVILETTTPAQPAEDQNAWSTGSDISNFKDRDHESLRHEDLNEVYTETTGELDMDPNALTVHGRITYVGNPNARFINGFLGGVPVDREDGRFADVSISFSYMAQDSLAAFDVSDEWAQFKEDRTPVKVTFTKKLNEWTDKKTGERRSQTKAEIISIEASETYGSPTPLSVLGREMLQ